MQDSQYQGAELYGSEGVQLGTVEQVLFHPTEPRALGLQVKPIPWLYLLPRRSAFIAWDAVRIKNGHLRYDGKRFPSRRTTSKAIGHDVDRTVVWCGMTVRTEGGEASGSVSDIDIAGDGSVRGITVNPGGVSGITRGRSEVPGSLVRGFNGSAVVVAEAAAAIEAEGGLADTASAGAAKIKQTASTAAAAAGDALVGAGYATGKAIRSAAATKPGKKVRSAWKGLADAFREGLDEEDPRP